MNIQNSSEQARVLLVDDNIDFLKSAKECLKLHGNYQIETASSVDEALEKTKTNRPDAIICDLQMPVKDGLDFLKTLRNDDDNIPFILFTVVEDKDKAVSAFRWGANGFVRKSGDPEVVFSTLQKCIDKAIKDE